MILVNKQWSSFCLPVPHLVVHHFLPPWLGCLAGMAEWDLPPEFHGSLSTYGGLVYQWLFLTVPVHGFQSVLGHIWAIKLAIWQGCQQYNC